MGTFRSGQPHSTNGRQPWQVQSDDRGRWQIIQRNGASVVHGEVARTENVTPPPPPPPPERPRTATGALTIECWSLPGPEADLARIERVVGVFVEQLLAAGVTI